MSGLSVEPRLRRALVDAARRGGITIRITHSDATRWASATFTGARHEIVMATDATDAAEQWLEGLPELDLALVGHLVADLKVVAMCQSGQALAITLEALTVEDR